MEDKGRTERRPLALAALATRQHGIVSAGQLRALGYSTTAVSKAAARGRLHRIHRRVYAVGHRDLTWEGRCLAAVLACAPALASHGTAAWLWGLLRTRPTRFQLTAATRRRRKPEFEVHFADLAGRSETGSRLRRSPERSSTWQRRGRPAACRWLWSEPKNDASSTCDRWTASSRAGLITPAPSPCARRSTPTARSRPSRGPTSRSASWRSSRRPDCRRHG